MGSQDQNASQGSDCLWVSRVPVKEESTSMSISRCSGRPQCHSVPVRVITSETESGPGLVWLSKHTHTSSLQLLAIQAHAQSTPPWGYLLDTLWQGQAYRGILLPSMLNLTARCTLLSRFCSANRLLCFSNRFRPFLRIPG